MSDKQNKVELLAPAGNFEKLEIAIHYGADAVYLGGKDFSLRNFSGNFSNQELKQAVKYAHKHGVRVYVTCNTYPRNSEINRISEYFSFLNNIGPDAIIIADPGVLAISRKIMPKIPVHLSTQANTTNVESAIFWKKQGITRINAARELTLAEIKEIACSANLEVEAFVHGAMCISYSGRCLLSSFLANRDANRGMCAHPCRWRYALVEEQRPGEFLPVAEDEKGAYVFNSRDLCLIEHIPALINAGINSFKIEGRMKGVNYAATTIKVYREAIDAFYADPQNWFLKKRWLRELSEISHRGYCEGFYFGDPRETIPKYESSAPIPGNRFIGKALTKNCNGRIKIQVRNKIFKDDNVEIVTQKGPNIKGRIEAIIDENNDSIDFAQPGAHVSIRLNGVCKPDELIRRVDVINNN